MDSSQHLTGAVIGTRVWAGVDSAWKQKKLEVRKMLAVCAAESSASSAPRKSGSSFFTRETVQLSEVYSQATDQQAVQSSGDTLNCSPAVHRGYRSN
jgi:hypothetical protein